ncbi:MAG: stage II sporulation protein R [Clostridia bacterium]|nr:stage II sporulation protein R [Clostridia bacterium]
MQNYQMQKKLLIAVLCLASALLFVGLMPIHGEAEIYDSVIRLHVLANSDSEEDQALKLQVRDAILEITSPLIADCEDKNEAIERLEENREVIIQAAQKVIRDEGKSYPVSIQFGNESYPRRTYDSFCFPAGEYLSMRVCIGDAEGQNWWCCLFPPLCLGAASVPEEQAEEAFVDVGLTPSQYKIITESEKPVYKVRFKILELFRGR